MSTESNVSWIEFKEVLGNAIICFDDVQEID
jgi:hypothetical protein